jgi:predicted CXXCH cytochrome family protein
VVGSEVGDTDGYYRFLKGAHSSDRGVCGIEHPQWNYGATASSHNEYLGNEASLESLGSFNVLGNTMTAYCTGCHPYFHTEVDGNGNWIRHPSDAVIKNEREYANAFGAAGSGTGTYDPDVPVARPSLSAVSGTVTLGTDLVMCLSCHVAHGSPNHDMLRWDYTTMIAGGGGSGGCFTCHTEKDNP